jgi:hypothetical protein
LVAALSARGAAQRDNHAHLTTNKISQHRWKPIILTLHPAVFKGKVLTFHKADFIQAAAERVDPEFVRIW